MKNVKYILQNSQSDSMFYQMTKKTQKAFGVKFRSLEKSGVSFFFNFRMVI